MSPLRHAPATQGNTRPCARCGTPRRGDCGFCTRCGARHDVSWATPGSTAHTDRDCPSCGREIDVYDRFCRTCGTAARRTDPGGDTTVPRVDTSSPEAAGGTPMVRNRADIRAMVAVSALAITAGAVAMVVGTRGDHRTDPTGSPAAGTSAPDRVPPTATSPTGPDPGAARSATPGAMIVPSTFSLADLAQPTSPDCGMPGYVVLGGQRYESNFLQCGANLGDRASGGFDVDLSGLSGAPDLRLRGFSAVVGIDEASPAPVTSATFRVSYGTSILCEVTVERSRPGHCSATDLDLQVEPGLALEMRQEVVSADPTQALFAAFMNPQVTLG